MFKRIKQWNNHRKGKKKYNHSPGLREFIYLDEVSVTSLLSSRLGAIPSEFKDAVTSSMTTEVSGRIEADAVVAKSRLGSSIKSGHTTNHQVVRKATIQATFKDLYEKEQDMLTVRPLREYESLPSSDEIKQLLKSSNETNSTPWLINETELKRGVLAELKVELQADPIFRASTVLSTVGNLFDKSELLKSQLEGSTLNDINEANLLLEQLMSGLIPIKCRLVDYVMVTANSQKYLLHINAWEKLPKSSRPEATQVFLTGVLEQELFWKDIRRVLFTKAQVKTLCRLNYDGVQGFWKPVKLVNILEEVAPDLAENMNTLGDLTIDAMAQGYNSSTQDNQAPSKILNIYSQLLADKSKIKLKDEDITVIGSLEQYYAKGLSSALESRKAFNAVTSYLSAQYGKKIIKDPEALLGMREEARQKAKLEEHVQQNNAGSKKDTVTMEDAYIDAEVIAVYW